MSNRGLAFLWVGLLIGNVLAVALQWSPSMYRAIERSFFQGTALSCVALAQWVIRKDASKHKGGWWQGRR